MQMIRTKLIFCTEKSATEISGQQAAAVFISANSAAA